MSDAGASKDDAVGGTESLHIRRSRFDRFVGLFGAARPSRAVRSSFDEDSVLEGLSRFERFQAAFHVAHARATHIDRSTAGRATDRATEHGGRHTGWRGRFERFHGFFHYAHSRTTAYSFRGTTLMDNDRISLEDANRGAPPKPQLQVRDGAAAAQQQTGAMMDANAASDGGSRSSTQPMLDDDAAVATPRRRLDRDFDAVKTPVAVPSVASSAAAVAC